MRYLLFISCFLFILPIQAANLFYTIDTGINHLLKVNADTGAVTDVGALGVDVAGVELAMIGNRLFGLDTHPNTSNQSAGFVDLLEISTQTGAVVSSNRVTFNGNKK